jgi:hypothetical protein
MQRLKVIDTPAFGPHRRLTATAAIARFLAETPTGIIIFFPDVERTDGSLMTITQIRSIIYRIDPNVSLRRSKYRLMVLK